MICSKSGIFRGCLESWSKQPDAVGATGDPASTPLISHSSLGNSQTQLARSWPCREHPAVSSSSRMSSLGGQGEPAPIPWRPWAISDGSECASCQAGSGQEPGLICFDTKETLMLEDRGGTFLPPQRRGKLTDWEWSDNESALVVVCVWGRGGLFGGSGRALPRRSVKAASFGRHPRNT